MRIRKKSLFYTAFLLLVGILWCIYLTGSFSSDGQTEHGKPKTRVNFATRQIQEHKNAAPQSAPDSKTTGQSPSRRRNANTIKISIPGIGTYLPHLRSNQQYLEPRLKLSAGRSNVSLVFGIPTIRRPIGVYVLDTVQSLFDNMSDKEAKEVVVVICINEPWNMTYETELVTLLKDRLPSDDDISDDCRNSNQLEDMEKCANNLTTTDASADIDIFAKEVMQGSLEVIAPDANFYPDLDQLPLTLGDKKDRVKWRSKQNLDYAFLMMYASAKGTYYVQLEDDLNTVNGFVTKIQTSIANQKKDWVMLQFSTLGFIGRLFKQKDVFRFMEFLLMFFSRKPCDWLLDDFWGVEICPRLPCTKERDLVIKLIRPTLFQHQGLRSSLSGTINKLKDKFFNPQRSNITLIANPVTKHIISTLQHYDRYDIAGAYTGKRLFWGKSPQQGDLILFIYDPPIPIQRIAFQTGHEKWKSDIIDNADVEVMPEEIPSKPIPYKQASHATSGSASTVPFYTVGKFDSQGNVDLDLHHYLGKIRALRVVFTEDYMHWVICEQIAILLAGH